jgi:glycosyltransferase involved in cell wall biosynthesis
MKKNRISVLMTVYNTEKYLNNAIKSVLKQTYKNFELIIVDDKSTDNSRKIIRKYKNKKILFKKAYRPTKIFKLCIKKKRR